MNFTEHELTEFKTECLELLEIAEKALLSLDAGEEFKKNFDIIFRTFHNLKGSSGVMGLVELQERMHSLENLLGTYKSQESVPKDVIESFLREIDKSKLFVTSLNLKGLNQSMQAHRDKTFASVGKEGLDGPTVEFLNECNEMLGRLSSKLQAFEKGNAAIEEIDAFYRDVHTIKGSSFLFGYASLGELAHAMESSMEPIRNQTEKLSPQLIEALIKCVDMAEKLVAEIENKSNTDSSSLDVNKSIAFLRLVPSNRAEVANAEEPEKNQSAAASNSAVSSEVEKEANTSIRVPVVLLDKLMALMGEMVLVRNQVLQISNKTDDLDFLNLSQRLNVVTAEIQGELMKTRMQPIGNLLSKFHRVVRDIAKDLGKKIDLSLSGSETELDKSLLEAIKDPLTHIIRNACDHGIENPEIRSGKGKSPTGRVSVHSYHEGGQVIVEVKDDGKGLDSEKLIGKALDKGLITPEKAKQMTQRDAFNLIFAPGFSTAEKVTNISGRGVGMDVVRTNVEKIGGTVELHSLVEKGTSIRLKIPLTLAIVPAMIVRSQNDFFAIPQLKLVELLRIDQNSNDSKIEYINGNPVYRLRGNLLPLVKLSKVLENPESDKLEDVANIVVLKSEGYTFGLIVDEIQDTADIVVKPLSRFLKSIQVFSGATVLGDGSIALILDTAGILKSQIANMSSTEESAEKSEDSNSSKKISELQDFLLVKTSASAKHAILLNYVNRLEEFKSSAVEKVGNKYLVRYRKSVLPLIFVNQQLGYEVHTNSQEVLSIVVIEKAEKLYGLVVDDILDVLITEAELDTTITDSRGIIGNLVTDEEAIVVLDPFQLIENGDFEAGAKSGASEFRFHLDLNDDQDGDFLQSRHKTYRTSRAVKPKRKSVAKNRILYVEDTAFFRKQVKKVLEGAGYEVTTAKDGVEGLRMLETVPPDYFALILSDIEMPNMNGFKFAQAVRNNGTYAAIPVAALSSKASESFVQQGLDCGFDLYLEKLNPDGLLLAIEKLIYKAVS